MGVYDGCEQLLTREQRHSATSILSVLQKKPKHERASRENFDTNAAFRLPAIRQERQTLTLPALAVYCTYKRKIPTRSSDAEERAIQRCDMNKGRN
jgi:hypothetical protein